MGKSVWPCCSGWPMLPPGVMVASRPELLPRAMLCRCSWSLYWSLFTSCHMGVIGTIHWCLRALMSWYHSSPALEDLTLHLTGHCNRRVGHTLMWNGPTHFHVHERSGSNCREEEMAPPLAYWAILAVWLTKAATILT